MKVTPTPGSISGRRLDRAGDPLEGLVNLFDLALVLAVGLLLAALSSAGVVGLVAGPSGAGTPVPGQPSGRRRYRLGVRTRGSQPRDRGSNPRTGTKLPPTTESSTYEVLVGGSPPAGGRLRGAILKDS